MPRKPATPPEKPNQIVARPTNAGEWQNYMKKYEAQIAIAFPRIVKVDRIIRVAVTAMQRNPRLLECTPMSVMGCMIQSAQLGLELDPNLGEAWMVPYRNGRTGQFESQMQIGYQGLMKLCRNSGTIGDMRAEVVREGDYFEFEDGVTQSLKHLPFEVAVRCGMATADARGDMWAVYSIAQTKDGDRSIKVMFRDDIEKLRNRSRSANEGPWVTDYEAMCKKTVIRQHCKMLPKSVELATAIALDELENANLPQGMDLIPLLGEGDQLATELSAVRDAGQKEIDAKEAAPEPEDNKDQQQKLYDKCAEYASKLDVDTFDDIVDRVRDNTDQLTGNPQNWEVKGLTVLLDHLMKAVKKG